MNAPENFSLRARPERLQETVMRAPRSSAADEARSRLAAAKGRLSEELWVPTPSQKSAAINGIRRATATNNGAPVTVKDICKHGFRDPGLCQLAGKVLDWLEVKGVIATSHEKGYVLTGRVENRLSLRVASTESAPVIGRANDFRDEPVSSTSIVKKHRSDDTLEAAKTPQKPDDWLDEIKFETHHGAKLPTVVSCGKEWVASGPDAVQAELETRWSNQIESVTFGKKGKDGSTEAHVLWVLFRPDTLAYLAQHDG